MIERYTRAEMGAVWSEESKFQKMLQVELAVCEAQNQLGNISDEDLNNIKNNSSFDIKRIQELECDLKHDILAFLTCLNEKVGDSSKYIHMGMTSSDIIDTGLALQLVDANKILKEGLQKTIKVLRKKAKEHKETLMIGRSHAVHAEPITFGVKLCNWIDILERNLERFNKLQEEIKVGQISGPVGTYSNIDPKVEKITCDILGLKPARISTQVIARDIHANYIQTLALIASCIEQFAIELRHLQRTEVLEVEEVFSKNQKGSSAMPHKKNPVSAENLSGLARVIRSNSIAAMENVALWHERDLSHSSVERIIFPDSTILLDYMMNRFTRLIDNLEVYKGNMLSNTQLYGGVIYSQRVLLKLIEKGLLREEAYDVVQKNAMLAWNNPSGNFKQNLIEDTQITKILTKVEIEECFSANYYLRNVNSIYEKFNI